MQKRYLAKRPATIRWIIRGSSIAWISAGSSLAPSICKGRLTKPHANSKPIFRRLTAKRNPGKSNLAMICACDRLQQPHRREVFDQHEFAQKPWERYVLYAEIGHVPHSVSFCDV